MKAAPRASAALLALLLAVGALAGCGGDDSDGSASTNGVGEEVGGSVAPLAQCRDWNRGTEAEKQATVDDIRSSLTPQGEEESGTSLSDGRAYELFERSCAQEFAEGFELYKLYARAQALAPLAGP